MEYSGIIMGNRPENRPESRAHNGIEKEESKDSQPSQAIKEIKK